MEICSSIYPVKYEFKMLTEKERKERDEKFIKEGQEHFKMFFIKTMQLLCIALILTLGIVLTIYLNQ